MRKLLFVLSLCAAALGCNSSRQTVQESKRQTSAPPRAVAEVDAKTALSFLASDEMEGRGIGSKGLDRAADFIATEFQRIGLQPMAGNDDYFQTFEMTTATEVGPKTSLKVADRVFTAKEDYAPVSFSPEKSFSGSVVFAGYGISSAEHKYDDYAALDAKGKVVLAMRYEPHDDKGKSRFTPDGFSDSAPITAKAKAAADAGATALLLVTPAEFHDREGDALVSFSKSGNAEVKIPVFQVRQTLAEELLKRGGAGELKALQQKIDRSGQPASFALADVNVAGEVDLEQARVTVKNVVGLLPGQIRDEYVVVGAHYDHLGRGGIASFTRNKQEIHNGADDNASGTTAMLKLAARMVREGTPKRSIIFIAFTGEEEGLIGSKRFVDHPPVALSNITAMLNLDMLGRIRRATPATTRSTTHATTAATQDFEGILSIGGWGTAGPFEEIVKKADERSPLVFKDIGKGGLGPSDHMSFGQKKIPVLFFFSGLHSDYHRPTDDAEKINYRGLEQATDFVADVLTQVIELPRQEYVVAADAHSMRTGSSSGRMGVTLGVIPDYSAAEGIDGVKISGTSPDTPAAKAGLQAGDTIVQWDEKKIATLEDLSNVLRNGKVGQKVKLKLLREGKPIEVEATLAKRS